MAKYRIYDPLREIVEQHGTALVKQLKQEIGKRGYVEKVPFEADLYRDRPELFGERKPITPPVWGGLPVYQPGKRTLLDKVLEARDKHHTIQEKDLRDILASTLPKSLVENGAIVKITDLHYSNEAVQASGHKWPVYFIDEQRMRTEIVKNYHREVAFTYRRK